VNQIKIYVDEDAMDSDLVAALRSRSVIAITALDANLIGRRDEAQFSFAAAQGCVLYTFNVGDFYRLHTQWIGIGRDHSGMILAPQQRLSVGEQFAASCVSAPPRRQLRCVIKLNSSATGADLTAK
jgi:hypothetical protein